jgi:acetyl-CoA acetyltransferase
MIAQRHMHLYGTSREAFAEVAINSRHNASTQPDARFRDPLSADEYFSSRMIAEPLCLYDFCMENDAAMAVIVTGADRARDLRHPPVYVMASAQGGRSDWGPILRTASVRDPSLFATAGHESVAGRLYAQAGIGPSDVDVALIYDHFSPAVILQLEDYGFCERGEGGDFVLSGAIRRDGTIPVNPHGGQLSHVYTLGMNHIKEAVEQLRGSAANQIAEAEVALVTGGPANIPTSATILRSGR